MAGIEEQGGEDFVGPSPQALGEVAAGRVRIADGVAACQRGVQQAGTELQCCTERAGPGWPQAGQVDELGRCAFEQGAQGAVVGEQLAGGGDGIPPAQARAEEDGEQLGVAEAGRPPGEQFLAGSFVEGPVADMHGPIVGRERPRVHRASRGVRVS